MALAAAQGRRLVQATRVRTRHLVFRGARGIHEDLAPLVVGSLDRARKTQRAHLVEGDRRRALERGARREAPAQGHARPQGRIKTGQGPVSGLLERPRDASQVRGPVVSHLAGGPLRADHIQVEDIDRLAGLRRNQANRPILTRRQHHVGAVRQRNWQARTTVVVNVLADDVDAPGRAPHTPRLVAKRVTEQVCGLRGPFIGSSGVGPHEISHKILLGLTSPRLRERPHTLQALRPHRTRPDTRYSGATTTATQAGPMFLPQRLPGQDWLGVVVAIPEPWVTQLTDLRLRLGDLAGSRIPAHITLMPPTPVAREARAEVIDHLRSIASRHSPFRVTLSGTDSFRPVSNVAFMTLAEGASDCTDLAEEIRSGPLDHETRFPYHPHVTLAQDVDDVALDMALDIGATVEASWIVPGFRLDRIAPSGIYSSMALFDFDASGH